MADPTDNRTAIAILRREVAGLSEEILMIQAQLSSGATQLLPLLTAKQIERGQKLEQLRALGVDA